MKTKKFNLYLLLQLMLVIGIIFFFIVHAMDLDNVFLFRESFDNMMKFVYCFALSFLPFIVRKLKINFTETLAVYYLLAIITHFIFGGTFWGYKTKYFSFIVHFTNSFLMGVVCYGMILRNVKKQGKLFIFLMTLASVMLIGGVWELFEYSYDLIFDGNMQKFLDTRTLEPFIGRRAIFDTMIDILMDFLGGVFAGLLSGLIKIKQKPFYVYFELKSAKYRPAMFGYVTYYDYDKVGSVKDKTENLKTKDKAHEATKKEREKTHESVISSSNITEETKAEQQEKFSENSNKFQQDADKDNTNNLISSEKENRTKE